MLLYFLLYSALSIEYLLDYTWYTTPGVINMAKNITGKICKVLEK